MVAGLLLGFPPMDFANPLGTLFITGNLQKEYLLIISLPFSTNYPHSYCCNCMQMPSWSVLWFLTGFYFLSFSRKDQLLLWNLTWSITLFQPQLHHQMNMLQTLQRLRRPWFKLAHCGQMMRFLVMGFRVQALFLQILKVIVTTKRLAVIWRSRCKTLVCQCILLIYFFFESKSIYFSPVHHLLRTIHLCWISSFFPHSLIWTFFF